MRFFKGTSFTYYSLSYNCVQIRVTVRYCNIAIYKKNSKLPMNFDILMRNSDFYFISAINNIYVYFLTPRVQGTVDNHSSFFSLFSNTKHQPKVLLFVHINSVF